MNDDNFKEAMIAAHGVDSVMKHPMYSNQIANANKQNYINDKLQDRLNLIYRKRKIKLLEEYKGHDEIHEWIHESCSTKFKSTFKSGRMPYCAKCNKKTSQGEREVAEYVSSLGFSIFSNDRSLIYPLELDIVIPELKIAIEYNGVYWHSEKSKDKFYHINKTNAAKAIVYPII